MCAGRKKNVIMNVSNINGGATYYCVSPINWSAN